MLETNRHTLSQIDPFNPDFGHTFTTGRTYRADKYLAFRPCVMPSGVSRMPLAHAGAVVKVYERYEGKKE